VGADGVRRVSRFDPLPDDRVMAAPRLPANRPPTRREVWERCHDAVLRPEAPQGPSGLHRAVLERTRRAASSKRSARDGWVWYYVSAFNFNGWRKQPDWVEGDPVIEQAVPFRQFEVEQQSKWAETVYSCLARAQQERKVAA
jgi:hypothetical protein